MLTDSEELVEVYLSPEVQATISKYGSLIREIYITDSNTVLNQYVVHWACARVFLTVPT